MGLELVFYGIVCGINRCELNHETFRCKDSLHDMGIQGHALNKREIQGDFPIDINLLVISKRGVLARVASTIADMEANIENVNITERDGVHSTLSFTVMVENRQHLARIMRELRKMEEVIRIQRLNR